MGAVRREASGIERFQRVDQRAEETLDREAGVARRFDPDLWGWGAAGGWERLGVWVGCGRGWWRTSVYRPTRQAYRAGKALRRTRALSTAPSSSDDRHPRTSRTRLDHFTLRGSDDAPVTDRQRHYRKRLACVVRGVVFYHRDQYLRRAACGGFGELTNVATVLGLATPRDAFFTSLAKFAVPTRVAPSLDNSYAELQTPGSAASITGNLDFTTAAAQPPGLSERNLACLKVLVASALFLAGSLGES
uniref:Uncharacterized protein n=1 Tax=Mycena chlorophos TaxID=658473 RepID=A0ABQ0LAB0_MYCCL|nr:predicted protein [Mycena chlorophos]